MWTATRPDGTQYTVSSRVTYCAIGWVSPVHREAVLVLLNGLFADFRSGISPIQAAQALTEPARSKAIEALAVIRQFDWVVGGPSTPVVENSVRTPNRPDNIGIFCGKNYPCEAAADLGDQAARALANLLSALGAIDVLHANID